jgi:hypothetical protein
VLDFTWPALACMPNMPAGAAAPTRRRAARCTSRATAARVMVGVWQWRLLLL